jgi:hypothetical protein
MQPLNFILRCAVVLVLSLTAALLTRGGTEWAFVRGMSAGLGRPGVELSERNLEYALREGQSWGIIGAIIVGAITLLTPPRWRPAVAVAGPFLFAWVSSYCFELTVAAAACC